MQNVAVMEIGTSKIGVYVGRRGINNTLNIIGSFNEEFSFIYFISNLPMKTNLLHNHYQKLKTK